MLSNSGDLDGTAVYYYNGQQIIPDPSRKLCFPVPCTAGNSDATRQGQVETRGP
jgi:hypothetical protein